MRSLNRYVVVNSSQPENAYGRFAQHILASEGLTGFTLVDLAAGVLPELTGAELILVTRSFLRRRQAELLLEAARRGAGVVFLQPQPLVVKELGFAAASSVTYPGTVRIHGGYPATEVPIQTHLPIPSHGLPEAAHGWRVIADALDEKWRETGHPAVVATPYGQGQVALFFYDVAETVARIRFGNPALGGYTTCRTWDWPHALDLFESHVDPGAAHLPQADLHGQLLARVLTDAAPYPLPRLWYYEEAAYATAGVFESDGDYSEPSQFRALASALEKQGGAATFYLMRATKLSQADVAALRARGHTFGPHVDPLARDDELYFALPEGLKEETAHFAARFGPVSPTLQCHCAPWPSYMAMAPAHIENGYRLLFAYLPGSSGLWGKYMCGSGRPLKFCDRDGTMHDCWQQPLVILDDESLIPFLRDHRDAACSAFDAALDAALAQNHTAMPMLSHPVSFCTYSSPVMEHVFERLHGAGAPIYNADEWLRFIDWRAEARVAVEQDESGGIFCTVSGLAGRIPVMFPARKLREGSLRVSVNGENAPYSVLDRLGEEHLVIQLDGEKHGFVAQVEIHASGS
ncbi:MAG TPA: hypothetical protein PKY01_11920 [Candidatus Hydrogenedentes bacterium]|nr:hypothetical protein [Candidatus Hydrogenedentota bacterium]HQH53126.1 hypothetical protein [Candidatus Hydrogenedentota bacterium]HQM48128.1 hypothetical protein [Candidatus Hydrogenedentota bacterium]